MKIFTRFSFFLTLSLILFLQGLVNAQQYVTTVGIQFKPIVPSVFFRKDGFNTTNDTISLSVTPKNGTSFGMVVRRGISENFSIESGINMITRNYDLSGSVKDTSLIFEDRVKWLSYEIPVQLLVFIRLGEKIYLNAAGGLALNFFPSDVQSENADFYLKTRRHHWWSQNLIGNLGFEYRSESSGYFYIGASYLQPFTYMATSQLTYLNTSPRNNVSGQLRGNYLTLDLRYFFHENPKSATRKKVREYKEKVKMN